MLGIHRGYVDVPWGQLHYAALGQGRAVVLIHQTPRSWDEFRDVLPLLGRRYLAIAPDTAGFGCSDRPPAAASDSIEGYTDGLAALLEALDLRDVVAVGHHTGALVALELAARVPTPVRALVLSSAPYKSPAERSAALAGPGVDDVVEQADGAHLVALWQRRQSFYPPDRPDLLRRFVADALRVGDPEEGHRAVNRYAVEDRVGHVTVPVLLVASTHDPFAYPMIERWEAALPHATLREIPGGMVPLPDQLPAAFARVVEDFVESVE